jgi:hypothetical protein
MKTKLIFAVALCAIILLTAPTSAPAQTAGERPLQELFQTETVYSQDKSETQVTFVSKFSKSAGRKLFENSVALEYGISDGWQVTLEWSAANRLTTADGKTRGSGDLRIGTKYSWMNLRHSNFHAAVGFELGVPTGNVAKGLGEGNLEYEPYVVVAKDFPKLAHLQVFSQFGVTFAQHVKGSISVDDPIAKRTAEWNSGVFVPYRKVRFTSEFNWSKSAAQNSLYLTPGVIWKLPRDLEFGVGVPFGITPDADRFRAIVKLVYEFGGASRSKKALSVR